MEYQGLQTYYTEELQQKFHKLNDVLPDHLALDYINEGCIAITSIVLTDVIQKSTGYPDEPFYDKVYIDVRGCLYKPSGKEYFDHSITNSLSSVNEMLDVALADLDFFVDTVRSQVIEGLFEELVSPPVEDYEGVETCY